MGGYYYNEPTRNSIEYMKLKDKWKERNRKTQA